MKKYYTLFFALTISLHLVAQTPPNDEIQNAIEITSFPFVDHNVQTQSATTQSGGGMSGGCDLSTTYSRVYYKINITENRSFRVKLSDGDSNSFIQFYRSNTINPTSDSQLTWMSGSLVTTCSFNQENDVAITSVSGTESIIIAVGNPTQETTVFITDVGMGSNSDIVNIPDANFKTALLNHTNPIVDTNEDGDIQINEAFVVDKLYVSNSNISDLTGVESFVNLKKLYCGNNSLTTIDVTQNTLLEVFFLSFNSLTELDISNNVNLKKIQSVYNGVTNLDVTQNTQLEYLNSYGEQNQIIDVTQNTQLKEIYYFNDFMQTLDLSQNILLENIYIGGDLLTEIDVTLFDNLESLSLEVGEMDEVNVSNNLNLKTLHLDTSQNISANLQMMSLDLSQNIALEDLKIENLVIANMDLLNNTNLTKLKFNNNNLSSVDLSNNVNLLKLTCLNNDISLIDLSGNVELERLFLQNNNLSLLDLTNNPFLFDLTIGNIPLTSLDLSANSYLTLFSLKYTLLEELDLSNNSSLSYLGVTRNQFLESINFNNSNNILIDGSGGTAYSPSGVNYSFSKLAFFSYNSSLQTICVDNVDYAAANFTYIEPNTVFIEDCTAVGVDYNTIEGVLIYDEDANGCDTSDTKVTNQLIKVTDGTNDYGTFTNENGAYSIGVVVNDYTTTIESMPNYIVATPNDYTHSFTTFNNTVDAGFCLTASQSVNDVNITLLPLSVARPGFEATYQLVYDNVGTQTASGSVVLTFDDAKQEFVSSSPMEASTTSNTITFDYSNLNPFEVRVIDITMNTFAPPTVNQDDILEFTAAISLVGTDENLDDNIFNFSQTVVNSYDPNDKQVVQGSEITMEQTSDYLDYIIRFQNLGTASAINVVVVDQLDSKLDWNTLKPVSKSHDYSFRVINETIEFNFENINLPAAQDDEAGSNGFVAFKIKPKNDIVVGDIIYGSSAKIYFDFNAAIFTNTVSTEVVENGNLSVAQNEIEKEIVVFPNPVSKEVYIKTEQNVLIKEVSLYAISGRLLVTKTKQLDRLNLEHYPNGIYFLKINTDKGVINKKIIKRD